ncbi:malic enzyme-like NAD(P)-binding protein [Candidatus Karelsulcia muelleri]
MKYEYFNNKALDYHSNFPAGKIKIIPSKKFYSPKYLSYAYSPGVAEPCKEIFKNKNKVYKYTNKKNLVGVITNGTAVLSLGDIGPKASKPVMEGKALLFKILADIDVFDLEINEKDPKKFIEIVKSISPTFGGINLEDIKSPEAFQIEKELKTINIPVMHDDQHGTAIISGAALINALELVNKQIENIKMVINGAGAAAISCGRIYKKLGVKHIFMCDSHGVLNQSRTNLTKEKLEFCVKTSSTKLEEIIINSDVFIGLSVGNILTKNMLKSMSSQPIIFALANPNPEIKYHKAIKTRSDLILATGRSDYPNQVNNALCFPYLFRGALDVNATSINEEMKLAALYAIAKIAKEPVPKQIRILYKEKKINFGKNYIIPKPFDTRLMVNVSMAVAKAAIKSGVAKKKITNWKKYLAELKSRIIL